MGGSWGFHAQNEGQEEGATEDPTGGLVGRAVVPIKDGQFLCVLKACQALFWELV